MREGVRRAPVYRYAILLSSILPSANGIAEVECGSEKRIDVR